jgi:hypothetical protein
MMSTVEELPCNATKHGKALVRVAARTSQADTVQYIEENSNTEKYNVAEQYRLLNTQQRKQCISGR